MANRFGEEYRPQHNGSDPLRFSPPRMKRPPYTRLDESYLPNINPEQAPREIWRDIQESTWVNRPNPTQSEKGIEKLQTQSYQADDESGSYTQNGANKNYHYRENYPKPKENKGGDSGNEKPNDKDSGGGSKVPRKPKPKTPSGGLKKPTPTKASK